MAIRTRTDSRLGPGTLTFDQIDGAWQVSSVKLTPNHNEEDGIPVLADPNPAPELVTTWTLEGEAVQDWELPEGFVEFARTRNGQTVPFAWCPNNAKNVTYSGACQVRAVDIGGEVTARLTSSWSFPVVGELVRADGTTGAREVVS